MVQIVTKTLKLALLLLGLTLAWPAAAAQEPPERVGPVRGRVTFIEFYADWCAPCVWMKPILAEMKEKYGEDVAFQEVDAWVNRGLAADFGVRALPTQMIYDTDGVLALKHEGFLGKEQIEKIFGLLGVKRP